MIFGFNTDVRAGKNVLHVQSEARVQEQILETMVFLHGHCLGRRVVPIEPAGDEVIQELLRSQHRWVVEAARDGFVEDVLLLQSPLEALSPPAGPDAPDAPEAAGEPGITEPPKDEAAPAARPEGQPPEDPAAAPSQPVAAAPVVSALPSLRIEFLGAPRMDHGVVVLQFCIFLGSKRAAGVELSAAWTDTPEQAVAHCSSGADGVGIMRVPHGTAAQGYTLNVTARFGDIITSKRFRVRFENLL